MQISLSSRSLRLLYYRYKDSPFYLISIFIFLILFSLFLFWKVVVPQISNWISINAEIEATEKRIAAIDSNIAYLSTLSNATLEEDYEITSTALPTEKDFVGMLTAVSLSANNASVILDDYSVSIGAITGKKAEISGMGILKLKLTVSGGVDGVQLFLKELHTKLPLSQVTTLQASKKSTVEIDFYYKPLSTAKFENTTPLPRITSEQQQLIQNLRAWWITMQAGQASLPVSSSSAILGL